MLCFWSYLQKHPEGFLGSLARLHRLEVLAKALGVSRHKVHSVYFLVLVLQQEVRWIVRSDLREPHQLETNCACSPRTCLRRCLEKE